MPFDRVRLHALWCHTVILAGTLDPLMMALVGMGYCTRSFYGRTKSRFTITADGKAAAQEIFDEPSERL